jgi:SanA protein
MTRRRKRILAAAGLVAVCGIGLLAVNRSVLDAGKGRIFSDVNSVPYHRVALVLGTSPTFQGQQNAFFTGRVHAAAKLYRSGKVSKLLLSGDHGRPEYDEPTAMKEALLRLGVPESAMVLDYAGFRTLDSVVRARKVFGVDDCVIVTDDFHLPRALYIADHAGVKAVGYQPPKLPVSAAPQTFAREIGSRFLVWLDMNILNTQPKFLGPHIEV